MNGGSVAHHEYQLDDQSVLLEDEMLMQGIGFDNDDDEFMEMVDEEEDEADLPVQPHMHHNYPNARLDAPPAPPVARACCLICQRTQSQQKIRLFKWPRDAATRRKWCHFFSIDESVVLENFERCYVCSYHFAAQDFLYSDDRIFWRTDAQPRYKLRRPATCDPFPWELARNSPGKARSTTLTAVKREGRESNPPAGPVVIHFRESKYKVSTPGKTLHPVAVIPLPSNPSVFYEFSYTRTSTLDGTKFYSCLQCRKAKTETKMKDCIRTIHLDGATLLSKGDPLYGHHFACRPLTITRRGGVRPHQLSAPAIAEQHRQQQVGVEEDESPAVVYSHRAHMYGEMKPSTMEGVPSQFEFVDEGGWPAGIPTHMHGVQVLVDSGEMYLTREEEHQLMEQPQEQEQPLPQAMRHRAHRLLKRAKAMPGPTTLRPLCYLCHRTFGAAADLAAHLHRHVQSAPDCLQCGGKCEPGDARARKEKKCYSCLNGGRGPPNITRHIVVD